LILEDEGCRLYVKGEEKGERRRKASVLGQACGADGLNWGNVRHISSSAFKKGRRGGKTQGIIKKKGKERENGGHRHRLFRGDKGKVQLKKRSSKERGCLICGPDEWRSTRWL